MATGNLKICAFWRGIENLLPQVYQDEDGTRMDLNIILKSGKHAQRFYIEPTAAQEIPRRRRPNITDCENTSPSCYQAVLYTTRGQS